MDDDIQEDLDQAAEHQQQMLERSQRETELLARAPAKQAELAQLREDIGITVRGIEWGIYQIFHGAPF